MELDKNIVDKVKDYLVIKDDIAPKDLLDILHNYRNKFHPDKHPNDYELQKTVEEKFKDIGELIDDLVTYIERSDVLEKPNGISLYREKENLSIQPNYLIEIHHKNKEIEKLKSNNSSLEFRIKSLNDEVTRLKDKKNEERTNELISMFKPSNKSLLSYGILFVLGLIGTILSKIDSISKVIYKYWLFSEDSFNFIILCVFFSIPILYIIRLQKEKYIDKLAKRIITSSFINNFLIYLNKNDNNKYFTEFHVYKFLESQLKPKNKFINFMKKHIFRVLNEIVIENVKDIFIHNLLIKKYIIPSETNKLSQGFRIQEKSRYSDFPF